jgi:hypothetical protein
VDSSDEIETDFSDCDTKALFTVNKDANSTSQRNHPSKKIIFNRSEKTFLFFGGC